MKFSAIELFSGRIVANYATGEWYTDEMYQLNGNVWTPFLPEIRYVADLTASGDKLVCTSRNQVLVYNEKLEKLIQVSSYQFSGYSETTIQPMCAAVDTQNVLWIADQNSGLHHHLAGGYHRLSGLAIRPALRNSSGHCHFS